MCCQLLWASDFNSSGFHAFCFLSGFLHHSYDKVLEPAAAHCPHPLHCCHAGRFAVCCAFASKPFFFHWCCSRFATCAPCPCPSVAVPGVRALSRRVARQHWPRWRWRCGGIVVWRAVPKSRGWPWRAASLCRAEPKKRGHCERVAASACRCTLPLWLRRYCATPCLQGLPAAVSHLLQAKADVDARDNENDTPLHVAAVHGDVACVRLLLEAGAHARSADVRARNFLLETPLVSSFNCGVRGAVVAELLDFDWPEEWLTILCMNVPSFALMLEVSSDCSVQYWCRWGDFGKIGSWGQHGKNLKNKMHGI